MIMRLYALGASVVSLFLVGQVSAVADTPAYPPKVRGATGVAGVKVGNAGDAGGLASTGFQMGLLLGGVALVVLGLLFVMVARRRHSSV